MRNVACKGLVLARRVLSIVLAVTLASYICIPPTVAYADEEQVGSGESSETTGQSQTSEDSSSAGFESGLDSSSTEAQSAANDFVDADELGDLPADTSENAVDETAGSQDAEAIEEDESPEAGSTGQGTSDQPSSEDAIDLALLWESGDAILQDPGTYVLRSDVNATEPLVVKLLPGDVATIDLAGHDVTVENDPAFSDACAIDLSANAGSVTFIDSSADESDHSTYSSVTLKVANPKGACAVVSDVRSSETKGAAPSALFECVSLVVDATWSGSLDDESELSRIAVVHADADEGWQDSDVVVPLSFTSCQFGIALSTDEGIADGQQEGVASVSAEKVALVDAQRRGIKVDGMCSAFVAADGESVSGNVEPLLASVYDSTYAIGAEFSLATLPQQAGACSYLVLGYPAKALAEGAAMATVATAFPDATMPESIKELLVPGEGFEAQFEAAEDEDGGYVAMELVKTVSENAGEQEISVAETPEEAPAVQLRSEGVHLSAPPMLGAEGGSEQSEDVDLNEAWNAQEGALKSPFTITEGGTYYLSTDLKAESYLVIDAAGQDVVLKFNGHTLTLDGGGMALHKTMLRIANARSVVFDGSSASGMSSLVSAGKADVWGISCEAAGCAVSANDLGITLKTASNMQRNLSTHAIRTESGTMHLSRCTVHMDMGNQTLKNGDLLNDSSPETPSAVYAAESVESVVLSDCAVIGEGSQGFSLADLSDTKTIGNAYALYSLASSTVVQGGSYKAVSLRGSATCLYGAALKIQPSSNSSAIKLEANASQVAAGVLSTRAGTVLVDAPLEFSVGSDYLGTAQVEAALRSSVDDGFVFGKCVSAQGGVPCSVLVLKDADLQGANAQGAVAGTFHADLPQADRDAVLAALTNALPQGACTLAADNGGAVFLLDPANAVASIDETSYYSTLKEALAAFGNGKTLKLLKDAGDVSVSQVSSATLDLNGCAVSSLEYAGTSAGTGLVVKNGAIVGTAEAGAAKAAVYHHATAPLTLSNVSIAIDVADVNAYGIYAAAKAGKLTLKDQTSVQVKAARYGTTSGVSAYGINMPSKGPSLALKDASVAVITASAGVSAYGLYSSTEASLSGSSVSASGTNATVCAVYAGGSLAAEESVFDVYSSDVASTAAGIWARTSNPKATDVSVRSCMVSVRTAANDIGNAAYACLLGATSETGTVAPSKAWTLSGVNTFRCAGDVHIGKNVGDVKLAEDFSLSPLSEKPLVISQASRTDNVGMTLATAVTEERAESLAALFEAEEGSNYEGWVLAPNVSDAQNPCLVWQPEGATSGGGVIQVTHGTTTAVFLSLAAALEAAESGDTLKLLADLAESDAPSVSQDELAIDLNGHALTLRAGSAARVSSSTSGGGLTFSGSGTLEIRNGTLNVRVGSATEAALGASIYQGIAVTGGGSLTVTDDAFVNVLYTGSNAPSAVQRDVEVRGIAVANGALAFQGKLVVTAAQDDGALGALSSYGVFVESLADAHAKVDIAQGASVQVINPTGAIVAKNTYYAEAASGVQAQSGPVGLREITINPQTDPDFYQEVVRQFRISASYDDPNDSTARNTFNTSIYYAEAMALNPEDESAWYNGLKIWAYTDEVKPADVGKTSSMVPTHFFVSSAYDTLTEAVGVATSASSAGAVNVTVSGAVTASCAHGNAYALNAAAAEGANVSWSNMGATLNAEADTSVHPLAGEQIDLRDYIAFSSSQNKRVAYSTATNSRVVRFGLAKARDVVVDGNASFTLDGAEDLTLQGTDVANIEASSFSVGPSFQLIGASKTCTVANAAGENKAGDVFARPTGSVSLNASLFADAYKTCKTTLDGDGCVVWGEKSGSTVLFKVGDAVVARYENPLFVNLSEVSARAARSDDQRQSYELIGWSLVSDENATSGYEAANAIIHPSEDAVYYAVYGTGLTSVPVSFVNVFDADGNHVEVPSIAATYGQTVGDAFKAAGQALPEPQDYTDEARNITYRFAGWYASGGATPSSALMYGPDEVAELEVTLAQNGVNGGSLTLCASYVACSSNQHLVTFVVDGYRSVCVVNDGERPVYTSANASNSNYVDPSKQVTDTGKTYTFSSWFVDEDGDGELDEGEPSYTSVLPPATADVTYIADYSWKWSDTTYTFYIKYVDKDTGAFVANGVKLVETTYEENTQELADSVAKVGSSFGYGGKVYTLDGWTTRKTDVEPLYDADNLLPSVNSSDRMMNNSYSRTYYGVYSTADHYVTVSFFEDEAELGQVKVSAASTSVDAAFATTGAAVPADRSQDEVFLGWAAERDAAEAIEGSSTSIESLAPGTQETLSLYPVFGKRPTYTVRLRTADGSRVLYSVAVKRGGTVAAALVAAGVAVNIPSQEGCYFTGWRTAAGKDIALDTPVTGSADYYAGYSDVIVESQDSADIDASATVSYAASVKAAALDSLSSLSFVLTKRDTADSPLRTTTAKNSYTILKSYDMRLVASNESGTTSQITGEFGTAQLKVYVGTQYRNAQVRAFWLGEKNGAEAVMNSAVKEVDSEGFITLSIGNFTIGDEDEGGNLAIAYIEGGTSTGTLPSDESTPDSTALKPGGSSGNTINSSGLSGTIGGSSLGGSALGGSLSSSSLGGSLSASTLGSTLGSSLSSGSSTSGLATGSGTSSTLNSSGASTLASSNAASQENGASEKGDGKASGDEEEGAAEDEGWGSEAWVLLLIGAGLLAALLRKLWLMFVVKPRRDEEEAEMPAMEEQYSEGIHF